MGENRQCVGTVVEGRLNQYSTQNVSGCCVFALEALLQLSLGTEVSPELVDTILANGGGYDIEEHLFVDEVITHVPRYAALHMLDQKLVDSYEEVAALLTEADAKDVGVRTGSYSLQSATVVLCGPECFVTVLVGDRFVIFDSHRRHDMTGAAFVLIDSKEALLTYFTHSFGEFRELKGQQCEVTTFSPWLHVEEAKECTPADFSSLKCRALLRTAATQQARILELSRELACAHDRNAALQREKNDLSATVDTLTEQLQVANQGRAYVAHSPTNDVMAARPGPDQNNQRNASHGGNQKKGGEKNLSNHNKANEGRVPSSATGQTEASTTKEHNTTQGHPQTRGKNEEEYETPGQDCRGCNPAGGGGSTEDETLRPVAELALEESNVPHDDDHAATLRLVAELAREQEQEQLDLALAQSLQEMTFECPLCMDVFSIEDVFEASDCGHLLCRVDARRMVETQVKEGKAEVVCQLCTGEAKAMISHSQIRLLVGEETLAQLLRQDRELILQDSRAVQCRAPDCIGIFLCATEEERVFECPLNPEHNYCMPCKAPDTHVGLTCEAFQRWREENGNGEELFEEAAGPDVYNPCPGCQVPIGRSSGCNHMICPRCKCHLCNHCGVLLNASDPYAHFWKAECPLFPGQ